MDCRKSFFRRPVEPKLQRKLSDGGYQGIVILPVGRNRGYDICGLLLPRRSATKAGLPILHQCPSPGTPILALFSCPPAGSERVYAAFVALDLVIHILINHYLLLFAFNPTLQPSNLQSVQHIQSLGVKGESQPTICMNHTPYFQTHHAPKRQTRQITFWPLRKWLAFQLTN